MRTQGQEGAAEIPRRFLQPFLLLALASSVNSYGYELYETVRARGLAADLAGVYRALRAMERQDLVISSWTPSRSGPDRRLYTLTDAGRAAAHAAMTELAGLRDALAAALTEFEGPEAAVLHPGGSPAVVSQGAGKVEHPERPVTADAPAVSSFIG